MEDSVKKENPAIYLYTITILTLFKSICIDQTKITLKENEEFIKKKKETAKETKTNITAKLLENSDNNVGSIIELEENKVKMINYLDKINTIKNEDIKKIALRTLTLYNNNINNYKSNIDTIKSNSNYIVKELENIIKKKKDINEQKNSRVREKHKNNVSIYSNVYNYIQEIKSSELDITETDNKIKEIKEINAKIKDDTDSIEGLETNITQKEERIKSLEKQVQLLRDDAKIAMILDTIQTDQIGLDTSKNKMKKMENSLKENKNELKTLTDKKESIEKTIKSTKTKNEDLIKKINSIKNNIDLSIYNENISQLENYLDLKNEEDINFENIISIKQKLNKTTISSLGRKLQKIDTQSEDDASRDDTSEADKSKSEIEEKLTKLNDTLSEINFDKYKNILDSPETFSFDILKVDNKESIQNATFNKTNINKYFDDINKENGNLFKYSKYSIDSFNSKNNEIKKYIKEIKNIIGNDDSEPKLKLDLEKIIQQRFYLLKLKIYDTLENNVGDESKPVKYEYTVQNMIDNNNKKYEMILKLTNKLIETTGKGNKSLFNLFYLQEKTIFENKDCLCKFLKNKTETETDKEQKQTEDNDIKEKIDDEIENLNAQKASLEEELKKMEGGALSSVLSAAKSAATSVGSVASSATNTVLSTAENFSKNLMGNPDNSDLKTEKEQKKQILEIQKEKINKKINELQESKNLLEDKLSQLTEKVRRKMVRYLQQPCSFKTNLNIYKNLIKEYFKRTKNEYSNTLLCKNDNINEEDKDNILEKLSQIKIIDIFNLLDYISDNNNLSEIMQNEIIFELSNKYYIESDIVLMEYLYDNKYIELSKLYNSYEDAIDITRHIPIDFEKRMIEINRNINESKNKLENILRGGTDISTQNVIEDIVKIMKEKYDETDKDIIEITKRQKNGEIFKDAFIKFKKLYNNLREIAASEPNDPTFSKDFINELCYLKNKKYVDYYKKYSNCNNKSYINLSNNKNIVEEEDINKITKDNILLETVKKQIGEAKDHTKNIEKELHRVQILTGETRTFIKILIENKDLINKTVKSLENTSELSNETYPQEELITLYDNIVNDSLKQLGKITELRQANNKLKTLIDEYSEPKDTNLMYTLESGYEGNEMEKIRKQVKKQINETEFVEKETETFKNTQSLLTEYDKMLSESDEMLKKYNTNVLGGASQAKAEIKVAAQADTAAETTQVETVAETTTVETTAAEIQTQAETEAAEAGKAEEIAQTQEKTILDILKNIQKSVIMYNIKDSIEKFDKILVKVKTNHKSLQETINENDEKLNPENEQLKEIIQIKRLNTIINEINEINKINVTDFNFIINDYMKKLDKNKNELIKEFNEDKIKEILKFPGDSLDIISNTITKYQTIKKLYIEFILSTINIKKTSKKKDKIEEDFRKHRIDLIGDTGVLLGNFKNLKKQFTEYTEYLKPSEQTEQRGGTPYNEIIPKISKLNDLVNTIENDLKSQSKKIHKQKSIKKNNIEYVDKMKKRMSKEKNIYEKFNKIYIENNEFDIESKLIEQKVIKKKITNAKKETDKTVAAQAKVAEQAEAAAKEAAETKIAAQAAAKEAAETKIAAQAAEKAAEEKAKVAKKAADKIVFTQAAEKAAEEKAKVAKKAADKIVFAQAAEKAAEKASEKASEDKAKVAKEAADKVVFAQAAEKTAEKAAEEKAKEADAKNMRQSGGANLEEAAEEARVVAEEARVVAEKAEEARVARVAEETRVAEEVSNFEDLLEKNVKIITDLQITIKNEQTKIKKIENKVEMLLQNVISNTLSNLERFYNSIEYNFLDDNPEENIEEDEDKKKKKIYEKNTFGSTNEDLKKLEVEIKKLNDEINTGIIGGAKNKDMLRKKTLDKIKKLYKKLY